MRIEFLGTGGFFPNARRHTACVMLPEFGVVFDAGSGMFRVPKRVCTAQLDIFLSHAHLDHVVGLPTLLVPILNGKFSARLHALPQVLDAVRQHLLEQRLFPVNPGFEYVELVESVPVARAGVLRHHFLEHPGGSRGFRIDWPDKSLAYITDTCVDGSYTEFVRGVDMLIHECYFPDEMAEWSAKTGHSNTTPVAELARDAAVGRLVLVHIDPYREDDDPIGIETRRSIFPQVEVAEDLLSIDF